MKAIIFDLDNCLSAADEVGKELYQPAFDAMQAANQGRLSDAALNLAFLDVWRHALDWVARAHGFTPEILAAGWEEFAKLEVTCPMQGYPDLPMLKSIPGERFLVTSGFRRLQASKIRALGIAPFFTAVYVDAIDEPNRKGKMGIFQDILAEHGLRAQDVFVIGDNPDSEIQAGNNLGMKTVQILRPGVPQGTNAMYYVQDLAEIPSLMR